MREIELRDCIHRSIDDGFYLCDRYKSLCTNCIADISLKEELVVESPLERRIRIRSYDRV